MLLGFFEMGRGDGDFDAGIEMALRRVLMSPDFLFRRLGVDARRRVAMAIRPRAASLRPAFEAAIELVLGG